MRRSRSARVCLAPVAAACWTLGLLAGLWLAGPEPALGQSGRTSPRWRRVYSYQHDRRAGRHVPTRATRRSPRRSYASRYSLYRPWYSFAPGYYTYRPWYTYPPSHWLLRPWYARPYYLGPSWSWPRLVAPYVPSVVLPPGTVLVPRPELFEPEPLSQGRRAECRDGRGRLHRPGPSHAEQPGGRASNRRLGNRTESRAEQAQPRTGRAYY